MKVFRGLAIFFLFILPIVTVSLPGVPIWLGRIVAVSSFVFFTTFGIFWLGINPRSKMIREGGKLNEPQFARVRPFVENGMRVLFVAVGILVLFELAVPLASDLLHFISGEKLAKFTATVFDRTSSFAGVLVGERSIRLAPRGKSYYLFYSWTGPLRVGESYEFSVLPRSRMILDFQEVRPVGDR